MNHLWQDKIKDFSVKFLVKKIHWKCISRFTRRGSWNLSIFSFYSWFVCPQFCCLGVGPCASIQLNGVRIPAKLNKYMANILIGLKVELFSLCDQNTAQTKLPWGNHIWSCEEKGRVVDVQLLHFIKVFNLFFPIIFTAILVQTGMDKSVLNGWWICWVYRAVMGGSE